MLIFWPLPINHDCSYWRLEWWILARRFSIDFAQIHRRNYYLDGSYSLMKYIYKLIRLESQKLLLEQWTAEQILCPQAWKQHWSRCTSPSEFLGNQVCYQWTVIFQKESFFFFFFFTWAVVLNSGLQIFSKPCCKDVLSSRLCCSFYRSQAE